MKIYIVNERLEDEYGRLTESKKAFSKRSYAEKYMVDTILRFGEEPFHPDENENAWRFFYTTEESSGRATFWVEELEVDNGRPTLKVNWEWEPSFFLDTYDYSLKYLGMSEDEKKKFVQAVHKTYDDVDESLNKDVESALRDWEENCNEYESFVWTDEVKPTIETYLNYMVTYGFKIPERVDERIAEIEARL